jgi:hypothetical protein
VYVDANAAITKHEQMQSISNYMLLKGDQFQLKYSHQTSKTHRSGSYRIILHTHETCRNKIIKCSNEGIGIKL